MGQVKHGMRKTKEYNAWTHMKDRCLNPRNKRYCDYGGRGITVCQEWVNSFVRFFEDMGYSPSKSHSLERVDNELGYSKENCKWATPIEQNNNTRVSKKLSINGITKFKSDWLKEYGITKNIFNRRIARGWDEQRALTTPPLNNHNRKGCYVKQNAGNQQYHKSIIK